MKELTYADFERTPQDIKKQTKFDAIACVEYLVKNRCIAEKKSYAVAKAEFLSELAAKIGRATIKNINQLKAEEYAQIDTLLSPLCEGMFDTYL
jgi:hypothetical protein